MITARTDHEEEDDPIFKVKCKGEGAEKASEEPQLPVSDEFYSIIEALSPQRLKRPMEHTIQLNSDLLGCHIKKLKTEA